MIVLNKIVSKAFQLKRIFSWNWDVYKERKKKICVKAEVIIPEGRKMILIPHADDEWIGCSAILSQVEDVVLVDMDMNGGDTDSLHKLRKEELKKISDKYTHTLYTVTANKTESLLSIIKKCEPDYIFLPFFYDWHDEHIEVMRILKDAIEQIANGFDIIMYQVSFPIPVKYVTHAIPLTKSQWIDKWHVFKNVYKSQVFIPYRRFACHERINGIYCNSFASEVYVLMSTSNWLENFHDCLLSPEQKNSAKQQINNISYIRKYLNSL